MLRLTATTCSTLFALLFTAFACSGDDDAPPLGDGSGDGGEDDGGSGGKGGRAGSSSGTEGGAESQGGRGSGGVSQGGKSGSEGGAASPEGGAGADHGGALGGGGEPMGTGGEPQIPEPDLITSSGGPWPDSLTGICSNGATLSVCPQSGGAYFGQDGTYRINVPSYSASPGTLKDEVTSLVWQALPPAQDLTQAEALTYCDSLELGGQTDWRLPTRLEYISLLDEGKGAGYALPPGISFDATGVYWTASQSGVTEGLFFVVDDEQGTWNVVVEDTPFAARCVRGEALTGTLQVGAGVVTDSMTSLTWQASELDPAPRTWEESLEYCESLELSGETDWRLPSIKELSTLVDESATASPVIAASFGTSAERRYWSSSPTAPFLSDPAAFVLDTDFGISTSLKMSDTCVARCVRTAD